MLSFRIKKFLVNFGAYLLVLIPAYFGDKVLEVTIAIVSFAILRNSFSKTYHADTIEPNPSKAIKLCVKSSIILFCLLQTALIKINISLLTNALIGLLLGYVSYVLEDYLEMCKLRKREKEKEKDKKKREKIIEILGYDTSQEHIFDFCRNKGIIDKVADAVDLYLSTTLQEASNLLGVDISTIKRRIDSFINKSTK